MAIDPQAVGAQGRPVRWTWTSKDALLYALGVGAGTEELEFTTENTTGLTQRVLPTFAVIIGGGAIPLDRIGTFNPALMVHAGQGIELLGEIPPAGEVETTGRCTGVWDKRSGALVEFVSESVDTATGRVLLRNSMSLFCRGEGGFGGERGPAGKVSFPDRDPDHSVTYTTRQDQALTYRLSGDRNPLHSDPAFARLGGFDRPILHGLCSYGFTGRALLHALCAGNPRRFRAMEARFSKPVYPGDSLIVSMWVDGDECLYRTTNQNGDVVIDQGKMTFAAA